MCLYMSSVYYLVLTASELRVFLLASGVYCNFLNSDINCSFCFLSLCVGNLSFVTGIMKVLWKEKLGKHLELSESEVFK